MAKHKDKRPSKLEISAGNLKRTGKIPFPQIQEPLTISFSFKHLDLTSNSKFHPNLCKAGYLEKLLQRLRDISRMNQNEFRFSGSSALLCHAIEWEATSEKNGFSHLNEQLRANQPWQFSISANEHGRVHGFFVMSIFYVVWIDPQHKLYS